MTWSKHISISCDESDCGITFFAYNTDSVFDAEIQAIEADWEEDKGEHYCPFCKDE